MLTGTGFRGISSASGGNGGLDSATNYPVVQLRRPDNEHLFLDGLEEDGIHPSAEGHRVMATEAARVLREAGVQPGPGVLLPAEGEP